MLWIVYGVVAAVLALAMFVSFLDARLDRHREKLERGDRPCVKCGQLVHGPIGELVFGELEWLCLACDDRGAIPLGEWSPEDERAEIAARALRRIGL